MRTWARVGAVAVAIATLGVSASAAGASGTARRGHARRSHRSAPVPQSRPDPGALNLDYQGGPVMHSNRTHIIFWNPSNCSFNGTCLLVRLGLSGARVNGFLANVAADSHKATNVFAITGQYSDFTGHAMYDSTFAGAIQRHRCRPCQRLHAAGGSTGRMGDVSVQPAQMKDEALQLRQRPRPARRSDRRLFPGYAKGFGSCFGAGPIGSARWAAPRTPATAATTASSVARSRCRACSRTSRSTPSQRPLSIGQPASEWIHRGSEPQHAEPRAERGDHRSVPRWARGTRRPDGWSNPSSPTTGGDR